MGSPALPVKQMQKFQPLANIHNALLHLHPSPTFPCPLPTQTLPHILHPYLATIYGPQQDTTHFNQSCWLHTSAITTKSAIKYNSNRESNRCLIIDKSVINVTYHYKPSIQTKNLFSEYQRLRCHHYYFGMHDKYFLYRQLYTEKSTNKYWHG